MHLQWASAITVVYWLGAVAAVCDAFTVNANERQFMDSTRHRTSLILTRTVPRAFFVTFLSGRRTEINTTHVTGSEQPLTAVSTDRTVIPQRVDVTFGFLVVYQSVGWHGGCCPE